MDFHSLMKKKLGGKYDQPKLAADDMAKEDDNNIEDDTAKEGAPETDPEDDIMLTPPSKITPEKSKKARKMAAFRPRVQSPLRRAF